MMDRDARPPILAKDGWDRPGNPSVQSAIRTLGISRDQTAELQGYIKRLLDEDQGGDWKGTLELLVIWKYQHEWETWGEATLDKTQAAIRQCVTAVRLGIPLVQPQQHKAHSGDSTSAPQDRPPQSSAARMGERMQDLLASTTTSPSSGLDAAKGCLGRDSEFDTNKPLPSVPPTTRHGHTEAEDFNEQKSAPGTYVRHLRGLHHEVLEIKHTPRGSPKLVVVENSPFRGISPVIQSAEDDDGDDSPILGNTMLPSPLPQARGLATNMGMDFPPRTSSRALEAAQRSPEQAAKQMHDAFFGDGSRNVNVANRSVLRGHLDFAIMPPTSSQLPAAMVPHQRDNQMRTRYQPSSFPPAAIDVRNQAAVASRDPTRLPSMAPQWRPPTANRPYPPTKDPSDNVTTPPTTTISKNKATRKRSTSTPLHPIPHTLRTSTSASPSPSPGPSPGQTPTHSAALGLYGYSTPLTPSTWPPTSITTGRLRRAGPLPSPFAPSTTATAASSRAGSPAK